MPFKTGDAPLLEHTVKYDDKIWGIGADGSGQNCFGDNIDGS